MTGLVMPPVESHLTQQKAPPRRGALADSAFSALVSWVRGSSLVRLDCRGDGIKRQRNRATGEPVLVDMTLRDAAGNPVNPPVI